MLILYEEKPIKNPKTHKRFKRTTDQVRENPTSSQEIILIGYTNAKGNPVIWT
jgi:hypothetical protein